MSIKDIVVVAKKLRIKSVRVRQTYVNHNILDVVRCMSEGKGEQIKRVAEGRRRRDRSWILTNAESVTFFPKNP